MSSLYISQPKNWSNGTKKSEVDLVMEREEAIECYKTVNSINDDSASIIMNSPIPDDISLNDICDRLKMLETADALFLTNGWSKSVCSKMEKAVAEILAINVIQKKE